MKKLETLKKALEMLNDGFDYEWGKYSACNCGLVARVLLPEYNEHPEKMEEDFMNASDKTNGWTFVDLATNCSITGHPVKNIYNTLIETGFSIDELINLEFLGQKENGNYGFYADVKNLKKYLQNWIAKLEKEIQPKYKDITSDLAVLPVEETSDLKNVPAFTS